MSVAGRDERAEARNHLTRCLGDVARGDRAALREVYDLTSAKLFGVCLRILPDREEAEDVLQDVYLTVWNRAGSYEPGRASPVTWLATIARNRSIDRLRALSSSPRRAGADEAAEVADSGLDALQLMEADEEVRRLNGCLDQLDERARGAIAAAFFTGRTYDELAREADVPLGTMKSVIRRALIRLRGCLER
ncbi:sigma-70 family RNA polymerase sigma factor [Aureimonas mangrovi]|uniref:sigma-70 family RNA polymerase sigma factor n=1 Tax=Aureimonas mangrovi TaxID=2758041 RepID=UPI001FE51510|nr:sigma-70 family RNA polymerase sigma factor [Aureimonas mangrovi]